MKLLPWRCSFRPVRPPRALLLSPLNTSSPPLPLTTVRALSTFSGPGRASALLYPGCHPVSLRHCPHPALLPTQGKAGAAWAEGWKRKKWEVGGSMASRQGKGGLKFPHEVWRGAGPINFTFANDFPLLQLQVRRQLPPVSMNPPSRGVSNVSDSQPFWGFSPRVCGLCVGAWASGADLFASETPSHLILPTLPASRVTSENIQPARGRVQCRVAMSAGET